MTFPDAGTPPASIGDYIEDMLNELAELAERLHDSVLTAAIREAGMKAAQVNAQQRADRSPL